MECAVELYSMTKSFSMAGWRVAFPRQQGGRRRAHQAEVVSRLRHLPADPDRGHGHDERGARLPGRGERGLRVAAQRHGRRARPDRLAVERPRGTMFVWAPIPEAYAEMGSIEFATLIVKECDVARVARGRVRPGRRQVRAVRPDRERAAHRAGRPPAQARPPQARLTSRSRPREGPSPQRPLTTYGRRDGYLRGAGTSQMRLTCHTWSTAGGREISVAGRP